MSFHIDLKMLSTRLKLQCFLALFLYCLTISESQVVVNPDSQWPVLDYEKYPPKENDEAYLYYRGNKTDLVGLKIQLKTYPPKFSNETLINATVTFEYWGRGGDSVASSRTVDYDGSTFFRIGVSFKAEDQPETNWATFTGKGGLLNDNKWTPFDKTETKALYPVRIMITPVENTDPIGEYFVALKSIKVTYNFKQTAPVSVPAPVDPAAVDPAAVGPAAVDPAAVDPAAVGPAAVGPAAVDPNAPSGTNTAISTPEEVEREVVLICTPEQCSDFTFNTGDWSNTGFPVKPQGSQKFLIPSPDKKPHKFTITKAVDQDTCVAMDYWITAGSSLSIGLTGSTRPELVVLKPTFAITSTNSAYTWYKTKICLDSFLFNITTGDYEVTLTPEMTDEVGQFIAISEITATKSPSNLKKLMVLDNWSKVDAMKLWSGLPGELVKESVTSGYSFQLLAKKSGRDYLYSKWFDYVDGHQLRQELEIASCSESVSVSIHLLDGTNGIAQTLESNLCRNISGSLLMKSPETHNLTDGKVGEAYRLQYQVDWTGGESDQMLTIRDVDLSDACRLGQKECNNQGACVNIKPNQAECQCEVEFFGVKCERIDFCEKKFQYPTENLNGKDYCLNRGGKCEREKFNPETHTICTCGDTKFWKRDATKTWICEELDACAGLNAFCPIGYKCSSDKVSRQTNCNQCEKDWVPVKQNDTTTTCEKYNPCSGQPCINGSLCKEYMGQAVCYCNNSVEYSTSTGCSTTSCNLWVREELQCQHSCFTELDETNCTCYEGWNLLDDGKACNMTFESNLTCQDHAVAVKSGDVISCQCLPGFIEVKGNVTTCVDVCAHAAAGNDVEEVTALCGTGSNCSFNMANGHVSCKCDAPYVTGENGQCHIDATCNGPDGKGYKDCQAKGALCTPRLDLTGPGADRYECTCPLGTKKSDDICIDQCHPGEKKCLYVNAVCQRSLTLGKTEPECVCQPGLKKLTPGGQCYLIENSIRAETVMRIDSRLIDRQTNQNLVTLFNYYMANTSPNDLCSKNAPKDIPGCIDYLTSNAEAKAEAQKAALVDKAIHETLVKNLKSDLDGVFGKIIGEVDVIHFEKDANSTESDYKVILAMEQVGNDPTYRLDLSEGCHDYPDDSAAKGYCLIPQNSVFMKSAISQEPFRPCNETNIAYCPSNAECIPSADSSKFSCACKPGFKTQAIIQMNEKDRNNFKEHCEDVNECDREETVCPTGSYCVNMVGAHSCPCNRGFKESGNGCVEICANMVCNNGECVLVTNNTGECRCREGYRGEKCDEQDPVVTTFKTALITVAVVLGLLLIGVVIVAVVLIKKTKKTAKKAVSQRAMGEYGRPQVPQRYQDNSGFTDE